MVRKDQYFDTAYDLLASHGYSGLRLAPLCEALQVTTGSFYHYFSNWKDFTEQLLAHWETERTTKLIALARTRRDPVEQLAVLQQQSLELPHGAEAAIRTWSSVDPAVRVAQASVDQQRLDMVRGVMAGITGDERSAAQFAQWGLCLLVGYEQLQSTKDRESLNWAFDRLVEALLAHGTTPG